MRVLTVQVVGFRVLYIDCNHFPISLALVDHGQDPEHLHFDYIPTGMNLNSTFQLAVHFFSIDLLLSIRFSSIT